MKHIKLFIKSIKCEEQKNEAYYIIFDECGNKVDEG